MTVYTITHPQALAAIWLAHKLRGLHPNLITRILNKSGVPRKLFILASTLNAGLMRAQTMNDQWLSEFERELAKAEYDHEIKENR